MPNLRLRLRAGRGGGWLAHCFLQVQFLVLNSLWMRLVRILAALRVWLGVHLRRSVLDGPGQCTLDANQ